MELLEKTSNMVEKAFGVAKERHKNQKRKYYNAPYFVHILDVAKYLFYENAKEEVIIAGILHDTLEDTDYTREELRDEFGEDVLSLVEFCTEEGNTPNSTKEDLFKSWKQRKARAIEKSKTATRDEMLIFTADKLSNLLSIKEDMLLAKEDIWNIFNAPKEDIAWYHKSLRESFKTKISDTRIYKVYSKLVDDIF